MSHLFFVYRAVLRSTDHGGIVNGGTALISYLFTKNCPPLKAVRMSRMVCRKFLPNFPKNASYRVALKLIIYNDYIRINLLFYILPF